MQRVVYQRDCREQQSSQIGQVGFVMVSDTAQRTCEPANRSRAAIHHYAWVWLSAMLALRLVEVIRWLEALCSKYLGDMPGLA